MEFSKVCRPRLLYTVHSNFAFKLFEFSSVPNFPRPKSTMTRAFNFSRFVFTLLHLLTFLIWLWHVWTGFNFDLLYFEFRTSKQCGLEPCKCHELNFSGLLLLFSFFSPFSSDYGMFAQVLNSIFLNLVFLPSQQRGIGIQHLLDHDGDWSAFENRNHHHQRCWIGKYSKFFFIFSLFSF